MKRFVAIWFPYLKTDWYLRRHPSFRETAFVVMTQDHGRMMVTAANKLSMQMGIHPGMTVADARALYPALQVVDDVPGSMQKVLNGLAEWCIRYTPCVATDLPDGLLLDATGCAHLWGGETNYLNDIASRLKTFGYHVRMAMADTIGAAWAFSRFGDEVNMIPPGQHATAIMKLPVAALRINPDILERLNKLGITTIKDLIAIPKPSLRRRMGAELIMRIDQATGTIDETIEPVQPIEPYLERLPCIEPILTREGIEIAINHLLQRLSERLQQEGKGVRAALLKSFRTDGKVETIRIGTTYPTSNTDHLFHLFELKLDQVSPGPGIDLFILEAGRVEKKNIEQERLWEQSLGLRNIQLTRLLDRFCGKFGEQCVKRYFPAEHYWPERSFQCATSFTEDAPEWKFIPRRPLQLLSRPLPIEVTAPVPDYPPMVFRYKGKPHKVVRADGPERIEQEWWLQQGEHRDYYMVEDEEGIRYWLFRLGHYDSDKFGGWFLHGFFA